MVATSASRAWMSQDTGNMSLRIFTPTQNTSGMVAMATNARPTLMLSMYAEATTATPHWTRMDGAKARYICTERMSELARDMS